MLSSQQVKRILIELRHHRILLFLNVKLQILLDSYLRNLLCPIHIVVLINIQRQNQFLLAEQIVISLMVKVHLFRGNSLNHSVELVRVVQFNPD